MLSLNESGLYRWGEPHTVILHRGQKGFGFVLRGAKADSPLMELQPSDRFPALQYLDDVDENGVADRAGLRKGDFILAVSIYIKIIIIRRENETCLVSANDVFISYLHRSTALTCPNIPMKW